MRRTVAFGKVDAWLVAAFWSLSCLAQTATGQVYTDYRDWWAAQQRWSSCVWAANTMSTIKACGAGPVLQPAQAPAKAKQPQPDKGNKAGIGLFMKAAALGGTPYRQMTCDQMISKASEEAGIHIVTTPFRSGTRTKSWFDHGMGPSFRQIAGGPNGMTLSELTSQEAGNQITVPIGSVIVADGHAALYAGEIEVGKVMQLLLFDANDFHGFSISINGAWSDKDLADKVIQLPGKQVGYHATRLQWRSGTLVKVFQPIGN